MEAQIAGYGGNPWADPSIIGDEVLVALFLFIVAIPSSSSFNEAMNFAFLICSGEDENISLLDGFLPFQCRTYSAQLSSQG